MTAQILDFPEKSQIAWRHIEPAIRGVVMERSGSQEIVEKVARVAEQIFTDCVPNPIIYRTDSMEAACEDLVDAIHQIAGKMMAEVAVLAAEVEILSGPRPVVAGGG